MEISRDIYRRESMVNVDKILQAEDLGNVPGGE